MSCTKTYLMPSLECQTGDELVAAGQRGFKSHVHAGYHGVDALLVKLGEADTDGGEKLVAGVLDIVLVIGIVDDSLQVAFIVADLHFQFKDVFLHESEVYVFSQR